jgi:Rieske 2Fe-2S family protein
MTLAPLDPAALSSALLPFGQATMLPSAAYTDPAVLAWERRHLFAASWSCVGRMDELVTDERGAGATQRALVVGDVPVLLTFPEGSENPQAFANTCRHRGHELLGEGGTAARGSVVCPYHAWSYGLDGQLRGAPGFRDLPSFDPTAHGLVALPAVAWQGWLFVNATGDAAPFDVHLGGMAGLVDPYRPGDLVLGERHTYEVEANWKVVVENYHECYHCPLIHPELCRVSPPASGANHDLPGAFVGGAMELDDDAETMSLDGRSSGVFIEGVDRRAVEYLGLMPNLLLSLHPDYVMAHRIEARAPGRTFIECSWYVPDGVDAGYAASFWDVTNREDWAACESVQRGLSSPHFRPGPFAPNEDAVHRFASMVARAYLGVPPHVPADEADPALLARA